MIVFHTLRNGIVESWQFNSMEELLRRWFTLDPKLPDASCELIDGEYLVDGIKKSAFCFEDMVDDLNHLYWTLK